MIMAEKAETCPICDGKSKVEVLAEGNLYNIDCDRCGKFEITSHAIKYFKGHEELDKVISVSYWIKQNQIEKERIKIDLEKLRKLIIPFSPSSPREQANNFILWFGDNVKAPNENKILKNVSLIPIVGAKDERGVYYILKQLHSEGIINEHELPTGLIPTKYNITFTFKGWDKYYELKRSNKDSRLAFMAMKFGEEPLNTIYNDIIKIAVENTGFEIRKLDEEKRAGLIDDKLRVEIRRSKFLLADLTHDNNGAYWEAGYAEGLGIPVIYICDEDKFKKKKTHFDTNHHLTVLWKNDEDGLKQFSNELKATIRATFPAEAKMED